MKKLFAIITLSTLFLCACSNEKVSNNSNNNSNNNNTNNTIVTTDDTKPINDIVIAETTTIEDKEVEIIHSYMDTSMTIAEYVDDLNKENKDKNYYVYDDGHYAEKIKESVRQEILNDLEPKEFLLQMNGEYPNVFTNMTFDNNTKDVSIYVNNDLYQEADFGVGFYALIIGALYSDEYQAYELILPNDRTGNVYIIDEATNEVLYSTIEE